MRLTDHQKSHLDLTVEERLEERGAYGSTAAHLQAHASRTLFTQAREDELRSTVATAILDDTNVKQDPYGGAELKSHIITASLKRLTESGKIVKTGSGYRTTYRTTEAQSNVEAAQARVAAAKDRTQSIRDEAVKVLKEAGFDARSNYQIGGIEVKGHLVDRELADLEREAARLGRQYTEFNGSRAGAQDLQRSVHLAQAKVEEFKVANPEAVGY